MAVDIVTYIPDHVEQGLARLPQQYRDAEKIYESESMNGWEGVLTALLNPSQVLEDVMEEMLNKRNLFTAEGKNLDRIGAIVGEPRLGRNDSDYFVGINGQISANNSDGTAKDIINTLKRFVSADNVEYRDAGIAKFKVTVLNPVYPVDDRLYDVIDNAKLGGVGYTEFTTCPTDFFGFTSDIEAKGFAIYVDEDTSTGSPSLSLTGLEPIYFEGDYTYWYQEIFTQDEGLPTPFSSYSGNEPEYVASNTQAVSQSFIANSSTLGLVSIPFYRGLAAPTGSMNCKVYAADGSGKPTGSLLGTSNSVDMSDLTDSAQTKYFTFPGGVSLTEGNSYCLVWDFGSLTFGGNIFSLFGSVVGGYPEGTLWVSLDNGSSWTIEFPSVTFNAYSEETLSEGLIGDIIVKYASLYLKGTNLTSGTIKAELWSMSGNELDAKVATSDATEVVSLPDGIPTKLKFNFNIPKPSGRCAIVPVAENLPSMDETAFTDSVLVMNQGGGIEDILVVGDELYVVGYLGGLEGKPANTVAKKNLTTGEVTDVGFPSTAGRAWAITVYDELIHVGTDSGVYRLSIEGAWTRIGETNGWVTSFAVLGSELCVGGSFSSLEGNSSYGRLAKWDGSVWSSMGSIPGGEVFVMETFNSEVYIGGSFSGYLKKWTGSSLVTIPSSVYQVYAMTTDGSNLYIGGNIFQINGVSVSRVAKYDGSTWSTVGTDLSNQVVSLHYLNGTLYAGGDNFNFAAFNGSSWDLIASPDKPWQMADDGTNLYLAWTSNIYKYDGATSTPYTISSLKTNIRGMATLSGVPYIGGYFKWIDGVETGQLAKLVSGTWEEIPFVGSGIQAMLATSTHLYVSGSFSEIDSVSVSNVAVFDGVSWSSMPGGNPSAMAIFDGDLYGMTFSDVIKWTGSSWQTVGSTFTGMFNYIVATSNGIYVGGQFGDIDGDNTIACIAFWDGVSWSAVGDYTEWSNLMSLLSVGDKAYYSIDGMQYNHDGTTETSGWPIGELVTALQDGDKLYVGGYFTSIEGVPARNIAVWDGVSWEEVGRGSPISLTQLFKGGDILYAANGNNEYIELDVEAPLPPVAYPELLVGVSTLGIGSSSDTSYPPAYSSSDYNSKALAGVIQVDAPATPFYFVDEALSETQQISVFRDVDDEYYLRFVMKEGDDASDFEYWLGKLLGDSEGRIQFTDVNVINWKVEGLSSTVVSSALSDVRDITVKLTSDGGTTDLCKILKSGVDTTAASMEAEFGTLTVTNYPVYNEQLVFRNYGAVGDEAGHYPVLLPKP